MQNKKKLTIVNVLKLTLIMLLLIITNHVSAQFEIRKYSVNSGGGTMSGNGYQIQASIAQVDVNKNQANGNYSLNSGFWLENNDLIFKNSVE